MALAARTTEIPSGRIISPAGTGPRHFVPLKNEPGKLAQIDKSMLRVDERYQRNISRLLVARLIQNWSWIACGALIVSRRPKEDVYFVMDGQHRYLAAMEIDKIKTLPCLVFELDEIADEAVGFIASNTERRKPRLLDQFKAMMIAGDPVAAIVDELVKQVGRHVGEPAGGTTVRCVSDVMRCVRADEAAFRRVWPVLAELTRGRGMPGNLVKGVHNLERRLPEKESLSSKRLRERILHVGDDQLIQSIHAVAALERNQNERTCAIGVLRALNRGLRNPIRIDLDLVR